MDAQKIGMRIQTARKERNLTQAELAQKVELTPKYLSNLERGEKLPKLETFVRIANGLQCDANSLLADVLDVVTTDSSTAISRKLAGLPIEEQRRLLRILDVMIDESKK